MYIKTIRFNYQLIRSVLPLIYLLSVLIKHILQSICIDLVCEIYLRDLFANFSFFFLRYKTLYYHKLNLRMLFNENKFIRQKHNYKLLRVKHKPLHMNSINVLHAITMLVTIWMSDTSLFLESAKLTQKHFSSISQTHFILF